MKNNGVRVLLAVVFALYIALGVMTPSVQASSTYEVLKAPAVGTSSDPVDLGVVKVTLSDTILFAYGIVNISLPSDLRFPNNETTPGSGIYTVSVAESAYAGITIVAPGNSVGSDALSASSFAAESFTINNNSFDIQMASLDAINHGSDKYFYIYFNGIDLNNYVGDIEVCFYAPSGSGFSSSSGLVIAKAGSGGSTTAAIKSVQELPSTGGQIDTITIMENRSGSLNFRENQSFKLEILTEGCSWAPISEQGNITYGWGFPDTRNESLTEAGARAWISGENNEFLNYKVNNLDHRFYSPGKISFNNLKIEIDPNKAVPEQEIKVKISGYDMDKATLVIAKYAAHHNLRGLITLENSSDHSGILITLYDQSNVIAQTVTDANGRFIFSNIPAGIYDLTASKSNWLTNKINEITIHPGETIVTEPLFLWFGDLNNDNTVDLFDLAKLCQNYGRSGL